MILILVLYAIFAAMTFINASLMSSDPHPIIVGMFRALGSGAIILGYFVLFDYKKLSILRLTSYQWYLLTLYGVLIHAFAMCGFSYGALFTSPISICFLYASAPFLTAIILYLDEKQALSWTKIIGLVIGLAGLIPILLKKSSAEHFVSLPEYAWLGNGIVFLSMIFFCLGWIFFKKLTSISGHNIQLLNGLAMIIGGIVSAIFVLLQYNIGAFLPVFSYDFIYLLLLFVLSSLITYSLYAYLLQHFSPTFISFAGFLEPAFAMLYGGLFFGYNIQIIDLIGFITLFVGLYIFYRQEL
jgi:drug/metabolite transporter (DMT)-like permease